jgi:hypothetical protein
MLTEYKKLSYNGLRFKLQKPQDAMIKQKSRENLLFCRTKLPSASKKLDIS